MSFIESSTYYLFLDFNLSRQEGEITISEAVSCLRHNRIDHYLCKVYETLYFDYILKTINVLLLNMQISPHHTKKVRSDKKKKKLQFDNNFVKYECMSEGIQTSIFPFIAS